jgi:L-alanine-DL-glutamate epimerase-like enolase superfamily enzyme
MKCENGYFTIPDEPGIGVEPAEEVFDYIKK